MSQILKISIAVQSSLTPEEKENLYKMLVGRVESYIHSIPVTVKELQNS